MGFLILLVVVASFMVVASISAARRRRAEERMHDEAARRAADGATGPGGGAQGTGGFGFPFGGLFGFPLGGVWSRSYVWDEATGSWIDVSDQQPDAMQEPVAEEVPADGSEADGSEAVRSRKRREPRPRTTQRSSLLGGLMGGGLSGIGGGGDFHVERPEDLTTFADVGGMEELKREVRETIGLVLDHPDDAERYGIEWNGVLLHGPPGVGKTFLARAIAGEHRMNLIHVSTGDLVSSLVGGSAQNIQKAFETALQNLPCLLFFDEFDSVAQRRDNTPDQEARRTVNQLLTSLEAYRSERRLLVMAATNSIEHLDPAVIRPGRFDRHIRIDLPDEDARRAIFEAELDDRPASGDIDLDELIRRTEGMTPAAITKIVDTAALDAFREAATGGEEVEVNTDHLVAALERYGGRDRPTVEHWTWDSLVLPENIKTQLQQLQAVIEDPESARRFGVDPPTGLLLAGPPGTGKTTIAKVLAAQARCSFYPVSGADVMSKWVGESERNIRQLFDRARENRPSIIFIDEIDAVAGRRGDLRSHDSQVNQLLAEIDGLSGQRGVFVIGATNRPDQLDPAMLRGGRLSRTIVLGLPDAAGREAILRLHAARMPTVGVRLDEIARETDDFSPADLKALCQEAALAALARTGAGDGRQSGSTPAEAVTQADFREALSRIRTGIAPVEGRAIV